MGRAALELRERRVLVDRHMRAGPGRAQTPAPDEQLRLVFRQYIEGMTDQLAGAVVL